MDSQQQWEKLLNSTEGKEYLDQLVNQAKMSLRDNKVMPLPKTKEKVYVFYSDPGHGWLAVKKKELNELGIEKKISSYSYQNGGTVYLEEDCDMPIFLNAKKAKGVEVKYRDMYKEKTVIRSYSHYQVPQLENV